jgi:Fe-S cluster assembly scaffold protein SufB
VSKSISKDGGITAYRGLVRVDEGAYGCKSHVQCDALILDDQSESRTFPYMEVGEKDAQIGHEATVSKIADEQLFYLQSRGLSQEQAMGMIVNGFIEPSSGAVSSNSRWKALSADSFVFLVQNCYEIRNDPAPESQRVDCSDADASRVQEL